MFYILGLQTENKPRISSLSFTESQVTPQSHTKQPSEIGALLRHFLQTIWPPRHCDCFWSTSWWWFQPSMRFWPWINNLWCSSLYFTAAGPIVLCRRIKNKTTRFLSVSFVLNTKKTVQRPPRWSMNIYNCYLYPFFGVYKFQIALDNRTSCQAKRIIFSVKTYN